MAEDNTAALEAEASQAKLEQEAEAKRIEGLSAAELVRENAALKMEQADRRKTNKELTGKLEAFDLAQKTAAEKAALEKGEYETLYTNLKAEHETGTGQVERMTAALTKILDAEVALMPENMRGLVPAGDVSAKLEWVAQAKEAGLFTSKAPLGVKIPGENGPDSLEAQLAEATKNGDILACLSLKRQIAEQQH